MYFPGVNTYFPHYHELYQSANSLLRVIISPIINKEKQKNIQNDKVSKQLIVPFILTMYSFLECLLNELEDSLISDGYTLPYNQKKRPDITERPFILYNLITNKNFDKGQSDYADFKYSIKIRNLLTHASGEKISWTSMDVMPVGEEGFMNSYYYDKKTFEKNNLDKHIKRNPEADKIIKFLAQKKLVPDYYKGRHTGWLKYISFIGVAQWYWHSTLNIIIPMLEEFKEIEKDSIKSFSKFALATINEEQMRINVENKKRKGCLSFFGKNFK